MLNKKFFGFTLSEVLIALTIIGVIAAITIPRVMTDSQTKVNLLKFKRAYLMVQEAARISAVKSNYDFSDITALENNSANSHPRNAADYLKKAFDATVQKNGNNTAISSYTAPGPELKYTSNVPTLDNYKSSVTIYDNENDLLLTGRNGAYYVIKAKTSMADGCTADKPCIMYIDINGSKGPNEIVMCTSGTDEIGTLGANEDDNYEEPDACTVADNTITDIYPFFIYDSEIRPATSAVTAVLNK